MADDAPKQCDVAAPCPLSAAHTVTTFTFHTGKAGWYRWQCFVPCAAGWLMGNGGPMQTVGYMENGAPCMSSEPRAANDGSITTVVVVWLILAVIAELALFVLLSPHMPPGRASVEASDQTISDIVLAAVDDSDWSASGFFGYRRHVPGPGEGRRTSADDR